MTLNEKQRLFTETFARWSVWCFDNGYPFILAEAFRPPWVAEEYARRGQGIKNSVHTKKLAVDVFRVVDGAVTWDTEDYRPIGEKWKSMHDLARWGGDFANRDAVHHSFEHGGVK